MAETNWEKPNANTLTGSSNSGRWKFLVAGVLLLGAVGYLIAFGTMQGTRYFITVEELVAPDSEYIGQTVRITGAVIGESIQYDAENLIIDFTIAHVPEETDNLALTLHQAVTNPDSVRMPVHIENEVMPDLLQNEAQAILTGELGDDGVFYASELLLKCPSRYEEAVPGQAVNAGIEG